MNIHDDILTIWANQNPHAKDIDYRTREERGANAVEEIKQWREELHRRLELDPNCEASMHQLRALSAVLWLLMPKDEYKKLVKEKK